MTSVPKLSEAHVAAIGELVVVTGHAEMILTDLIGLVTGMDLLDAIVAVDHQLASSKIDSLKTLIDRYSGNGPTRRSMDALMHEIKSLTEFRNSVIHSHWHVNSAGVAHTVHFSAHGKLVRSRESHHVGSNS